MRKTSVPLYIAAFAITVLIFGIGIYVGTVLNQEKVNSVQSEIENTNQLALSSQLMVLFGDSPSFCPVYQEELGKLDSETENAGLKVTYLEDVQGVVDENLKRQYFTLEANAFLLSEKVKEKCGANYTTILYFYSNRNCGQCAQQGHELLNLKQKMGEKIRIYSFDGELGSTIANALGKEYGIKNYPALVVGANRTVNGFMNEAELEKQII